MVAVAVMREKMEEVVVGSECILGWDEIRVRVLLEIILGAISGLLNHVI